MEMTNASWMRKMLYSRKWVGGVKPGTLCVCVMCGRMGYILLTRTIIITNGHSSLNKVIFSQTVYEPFQLVYMHA